MIISGKEISKKIKEQLKVEVEEIKNKYPEILELDTTIQKLCLNLQTTLGTGMLIPRYHTVTFNP